MADEKRDAPVVTGQEASTPAPSNGGQSATTSIPQQAGNSQGKPGKKAHKSRNSSRRLKLDSRTYSIAIKCYIEQMPHGLDYTVRQLQALDKREWQFILIQHYRDTVEDGEFWETAAVKPHFHIIGRAAQRDKRMVVKSLLDYLGIVFRKGQDEQLWNEHGVETVGDFANYAMYLTHETKEAIEAGKELYRLDELISNMTVDEVKQIRDGYTRLTNTPHKVTTEDLIQLDAAAYELGQKLGDFNAWYGSQPFVVRSNTRMRTVRESYNRGVEDLIEQRNEMIRLCVYIEGDGNTGKTYAALKALAGRKIHIVRGGGSGKFDALRPDHDAILIDDDICPNLLNMTDNFVCHAYKRNRDNPVWAGRFFVVTSNLPFIDWLEACGIKVRDFHGNATKHCYAMSSRFFTCGLEADANGVNHLACRSVSNRGTAEVQIERANMFMWFKQRFDDTIAGYVPGMNTVDFSSIIEPAVGGTR